MLKAFSSLIVGILTFIMRCPSLSADIIETHEIASVQNPIDNDSFVLFNITGTLYEPATTLADNQWRIYFTERAQTLVSDRASVECFVNKIKNDIVNHLPKKSVEDFTPRLIANLQSQQIRVLGITQKQMVASYADNFGLMTRNHLLSIGIDLEKTLSYLHLKNDSGDDGSHSFAYGLIFTNGKSVGPAILAFLERLQSKPTKIIMIDNSRRNLENAQMALASTDIKFKGFRYGRADMRKAHFDPLVGTIQFFAFINEGRIMSDEEAN